MTINETLEAIKEFISEEVAQKVLLQLEESEEYVHPYVDLCHLPHKNFTPGGFQVPYILVTFDNSSDSGSEATSSIRIVFATYGGGYYKDPENNQTTIPDAKGYKDLLNVMESTKQKLMKASVIKESTSVRPPFTLGMYNEENTWPYWYGYMSFEASVGSDEYILNEQINKYL